MEHEYNYNYVDIDAYIRRANQMRSEALGQWMVAGWNGCKRLVQHALPRKTARSQTAKPAHTRELAY